MWASALSAMTLGAWPPLMRPMFRVEAPILRFDRQGQGEDVVQRGDELVDGGFAEFGVGGVGHAALGADFDAECAFGGDGEAVVGGLAVDEEARAAWALVGDDGAGGVALLADDEEQADLDAGVAQAISGGDLRGDDALGVAGAAAVEVLVVFAAAEEGRHGVHVGGENDIGRDAGKRGVDVEALVRCRRRE